MANEKSTIMVLKVDLECSSCYKKVKKVLCKFPQIRDQVFDEKTNTVMITVVCCSPEKIRDKLCCKGGKAIKSIEIKESPKPKDPEKPKEPEKPKVVVEKPKEPEKQPKVTVVEPKKPKSNGKGGDKPKSADKPVEKPSKTDPPKEPAPAPKPGPIPQPGIIKLPDPNPVNGYPPQAYPPAFPPMPCCEQCYNGHGGGPCHQGFGRPVPPPPGPCFDGYGYGYGGNRACYVTRCDYFNEENPSGCSIM